MLLRLYHSPLAAARGPWVLPRLLGLLGLLLCHRPLLAQQRPATALVSSASEVTASQTTPTGQDGKVLISGRVLGPEGETLSGATAQLQGTSTIAVSNAEGQFVLPIKFGAGPVHIICRYAGYDDSDLTLTRPPTAPVLVEMAKTVKAKLPVTGQVRDL